MNCLIRGVLSSFFLMGSLTLTSCYQATPKALPPEHAKYNDAVDDALNTEILTNIVREYYNESPAYLSISSIYTTQNPNTYSASLSPTSIATGKILDDTSGYLSLTPEYVSASITYTPNTGSDYAERLLRPLSLKFLAAIGYSESNLRDIFRIAVGRIGPWDNSYPWPNRMSQSEMESNAKKNIRFDDLLEDVFSMNGHVLHVVSMDQYVRDQNQANATDADSADETGNTDLFVIEVPVKKGFNFTPGETALLDELGVGTDIDQLVLSPKDAPGAITFVPRTVIGIHKSLSLLIHGADYPEKTKGLRDLTGDHFFSIFMSSSAPKDAYVKTLNHGKWYYIKNSDSETKSAFETLELLYDVTRIVPESGVSYVVN